MKLVCVLCTSSIFTGPDDLAGSQQLCVTCENTINEYTEEVVTDGSRIAESVKDSMRAMVGSAVREARKAAVNAKNEEQFIANLQKKMIR